MAASLWDDQLSFSLLLSKLSLTSCLLYLSLSFLIKHTRSAATDEEHRLRTRARQLSVLLLCVCVCAVRAHMCLSQWCEKSRGTYLLSLLVVGFQFDAKRSAHLRSHTLSLACVCAWACPLARCSSGVGQTLSLLHFSQCGTTRLQPAASHGS